MRSTRPVLAEAARSLAPAFAIALASALAAAVVLGPLVGPELAAQGTIRGVVFDSLMARAPLAGATVVLQGAPQTAVTDRNGRFVLRDVPAGTFGIGFFHPRLDSLEATAPLSRVTVADGATATVRLGMPTANSLAQALCGRALEPATAVVFGLATEAESGAPLPGTVVRATWFEARLEGGAMRESRRLQLDTARVDGRYVLCGVPNDVLLSMLASHEGQWTGDLPLALDHQGIGRRDVMVSRTDTAARPVPVASADDTLPPRRSPGSARLRVTVVTEEGRPVQGATVGVRQTAANGLSNAEGVVRLAAVPAGSQTLLVRRPGAQPVTQVVALRAGAETAIEVRLGRSVVQLPTVAVTGQRTSGLDREIRARISMGAGLLFDEKALEKAARGSYGFWASMRGVRVTGEGFDPQPYMLNSYNQPCRPILWYNGARLMTWEPWELRTMLIGAKRMEVYPRPGQVPAQLLSNENCGAIAVWT